MFPKAHRIRLLCAYGRVRAVAADRDAASLVATRWRPFLGAEPASRAWE
jgi:hypothetical protein